NFSAGMSIGNQVIGGKKVIPNPYVNENGEYEQIEINLFNDRIKSVATDELARARLLPKTSLDQYNANEITFSKTYQRKKDAYEHHSFTVCFEIKSLEDDIIIGPAIAKDNPLWWSARLEQFVYVSSEKYNIGDKKIKGSKALNQNITISNGYVVVSFDNTDIQSWAIGDVDGNLYIACNRPSVRTIQFQRRKTL
ncbi:MAG: hypothetical protein M0R05_06125, partial [Bacilli bacterium]|nr:hypothetical protein [Bacilli bacterium]